MDDKADLSGSDSSDESTHSRESKSKKSPSPSRHSNGKRRRDQDDGGEEHFIVSLRGMPYTSKDEHILDFLEGCIIVGGRNGIHFCYGDDGRPTGDAFVELASEEDIQLALVKNKNHIGRRYVEVFQTDKREMDFVLSRGSSAGGSRGGTGKSADAVVRIRGLPYECTKEQVSNFFLGLTIVPNGITIMTDHQGRSTGDGFVQFTTPDCIDLALEKHKESIGTRYIEVYRSSLADMRKILGPRGSSGRSGSDRRGPYDRPDRSDRRGRTGNIRGLFDSYDRGDDDRYGSSSSRRRDSDGGRGPRGRDDYSGGDRYGRCDDGPRKGPPVVERAYRSSTGHHIYMRGLPFTAGKTDIKKFFSPLVPAYISIEEGIDGRPTGNANVDFSSHQDALDALGRDHLRIGQRYIELFHKEATRSDARSGR